MTLYLGYRLAKFLGVGVFAAGCVGTAFSESCRDRSTYAYGWTSAGWLICWIAGYGMLKSAGLSFREPFVTVAMLASMVALLAAVARAQELGGRWMGAISVGAAAVAIAGMGLKGIASGPLIASAIGVGAALLSVVILVARGPVARGDELIGGARTWFRWVARFEGLSLLALFGIYMPAKYALHVELDGGQGWFGWVHGMLFLMYLLALISVSYAAGWSFLKSGIAFVASLVPLGTFAFEWVYGEDT